LKACLDGHAGRIRFDRQDGRHVIHAHVRLRPVPASASQARRFVAATLSEWGLEQATDVVSLLVSELVTNAVLHARSDVEVVVRLGDSSNGDGNRPVWLHVEVHDSSPVLPVVREYEDETMTGRGLALVRSFAFRWGVSPSSGGKSVWFELDPERLPA